MSFSETYFEALELARGPTLGLVSRLDGDSVKAIAKPWLTMLFHVIRDTEPALELAIEQCANSLPGSALDALRLFFEDKLVEEVAHAEMLRKDASAAGVEDVATSPVNPFVAEMVGRQSYLIRHVHPSAYLGFMGLLEGFPPTLAQLDAIQEASGLTADAFRTARLHAGADVVHRRELAFILDMVPGAWQAAILSNGVRCAQLQYHALALLAPFAAPRNTSE